MKLQTGPFKQYVEQSFRHYVSFSQTVSVQNEALPPWCLVSKPSLNSANLNAGLKKCTTLGDATLEGTLTDSSSESAGKQLQVSSDSCSSEKCARLCSISLLPFRLHQQP